MPNEITIYEDPQAMEAIRYYTDPLLPTFGNKTASAAAAGLKTATVFNRNAVQEEIKKIVKERAQASRDVLQFLGTYTADAARELVHQLSTGRELELVDPTPLFREDSIEQVVELLAEEGGSERDPEILAAVARGIVEGQAKKAEAMIKHNNTTINASKERRAAAIEILRQQIGTPEQRVRVTRDQEPTPLADMEDDKIEELLGTLSEELDARKPREAEVVPEADVEIL